MKYFIRPTKNKIVDTLINVMFIFVGFYALGYLAGVAAAIFEKVIH